MLQRPTAMDPQAARHAIYFTPEPDHPLQLRAACWLGRSPQATEPFGARPGGLAVSPAEIAEITTDPARYGFHATLKAPFRLRPEHSVAALDRDVEHLASRYVRFVIERLEIGWIGGALALVYVGCHELLSSLAFEAVLRLDRYRAPLQRHDVDRRLAAGLTPRQEELLNLHGYPYVAEQFRFHMTLTNDLSDHPLASQALDAVNEWFGPVLAEPLPFDAISRFEQPTRDNPMLELRRFPLNGAVGGRMRRGSQ
ncbi:MAG: DUF1045 domain-containing protein, partial [Gammaproteobacteria bacterium]|nr:DUF1045 domain-containing protein [Gammaproteobacteria bacterium]